MAKKAKKGVVYPYTIDQNGKIVQGGSIDKTLDDWKKDGHWIVAGRRISFPPMRIGNKD